MKNFLFFVTFIFCGNLILSQTDEDFSSSTDNATSFTSNSVDFSLSGDWHVEVRNFFGAYGDDHFVSGNNSCGASSKVASLYTTNSETFVVHRLLLYPSTGCNHEPSSGNVTIAFFNNNTLIDDTTLAVTSSFPSVTNGYQMFDLNSTSLACLEVDSISFSYPDLAYLAIDDFYWSTTAEITPSITSVVIDGGINNQCPGAATINLTATATYNDLDTLKWYGNSEGTGTPLGTGLTLTNQTPDSTTTYYAKINGLCGTNVSDQVTYTAKDTAVVTSITSNKNNICSVDSVELTAAIDLGDNGSFEWFDQANGQGNSLGTDLTITQTPGSTKKYYAYITSTCNNAQDSIEITVDPTKTVSTLTDITSDEDNICDGTQITVTANGVTLGTGATGNWYPQANGQGDAISSNTSIDTVPLVTNKYYYYIAGECNTVQDSIEITVLNTDTTVTNDGSSLTSAATGVDYNWLNCADNSSTGVTTQSFTPTETGNYKVEITNSTCVDTSNCQNITITSLNGQLSQLGVVIYPNPAQNFINISLAGNFTVTIMNANGMQVIAPTSSSQINLSDLSSGVYFIEITKNDISETFKVIKE